MNDAPILPDDEPPSMPSLPTQWGGDPATLGLIDHYDLLCKLGGGGFGVVYLARDTVSGVEVALKTLHPLLKHNAEEMDLLREKFALVSRLAHPNIATALVLHPCRDINLFDETARRELKLSPGDSVMVMRYAPGVTLSRWRRQFPGGVVPPDLALEVGRQIAAALDYAHGEKIVHRDIKPSNVMVETVAAEPRPLDHGQNAARSLSAPTLRVRILDFGLAAEIRSSMSRVSTESGDTSGTRPYMAPEQWLGRKQDGRTDQYALACVLYELLSGAPPFAGVFETGDPAIMERAVLGRAPDEIEDATPAVNAALLRALAKNPKDRFPSCAAFVAALASTTEHTEDTEGRDGSTSRPPSGCAVGASLPEIIGEARWPSASPPPSPPAKRHRSILPWIVLIAAVLTVFLIGVLFLVPVSVLPPPPEPSPPPVQKSVGASQASASPLKIEPPPQVVPVLPTDEAPHAGTHPEAAIEQALVSAAALEKAGKLYEARDMLLVALDQADENDALALEQVLGRLATDIYFTPCPGPDKVVYAVKEGDSFAKIAARYACPVELIKRANKVGEALRIRPGQTLVFPDHPKFAVTVSKSKNTLLLTLNGKFFKRYSVGTGANDKTPTGTWKMADRVENPSWWKDGRMIPYGDPENILGTHWLALEATGETPHVSGYGIHGTWDESSLGRQTSAGCIRMRNSDVEELYVLLPRGTPVSVQP